MCVRTRVQSQPLSFHTLTPYRTYDTHTHTLALPQAAAGGSDDDSDGEEEDRGVQMSDREMKRVLGGSFWRLYLKKGRAVPRGVRDLFFLGGGMGIGSGGLIGWLGWVLEMVGCFVGWGLRPFD
jgi:hypothetical protein